MTAKPKPTGLALLREPFESHQINKLPKQLKKDDQDKGKCERGTRYSADGFYCGGWHARSLHLDFVGHAALTDRLLDADPEWSWEPVAWGPDGLPAFDKLGGLWIRLTVCGVSRLGYGDAQGKSGPNAIKEAIGDALRNAGMRFGAALDLWHKGDLHAGDHQQEPADKKAERQSKAGPPADDPWTVPEGQIAPDPAPPKPTDAEWFTGWQDRVSACLALNDLAALYDEAKEARRTGRLTKADFEDAVVLKDVQKAAIERASGDWPEVAKPGSGAAA